MHRAIHRAAAIVGACPLILPAPPRFDRTIDHIWGFPGNLWRLSTAKGFDDHRKPAEENRGHSQVNADHWLIHDMARQARRLYRQVLGRSSCLGAALENVRF